MRYILDHGHRQIAILGMRSEHSGKYSDYTGLLRRRINGYVRALERVQGLSIDDRRIRLIECTVEAGEGYRAFRSFWRTGWHPTAIVAMADMLLVACLRAIHELDLNMPDDLSLMGFDDIAFSALTSPPLTTVRQPSAEKGRVAARLLLDLIEGKAVESEHIVLPVEFVERQSVRTLR